MLPMAKFKVKVWLWLLLALSLTAPGQVSHQGPAAQSPSPMVDHTRPHPRLQQKEASGRHVDLKSLKGARLFLGPHFNPNRPVPLLVHFHGAPWLIELHIVRYLPRAALITVQLGAGSNAYRRPFEQPDVFQALIAEAAREAGVKRLCSSVTLTCFSAGYGAVRVFLRRPGCIPTVTNWL